MSTSASPALKAARVEKPTPLRNPDPNFCSYYVSRKHRFCRTECKSGSLYCCTHDIPDSAASSTAQPPRESPTAPCSSHAEDVRVPCPINPNHTVYASRLAKHVKVCPDLRFVTDQLPYHCENKHANQGVGFVGAEPVESTSAGGARRTHRDLSAEELEALIQKVADCYHSAVEPKIVRAATCGVDEVAVSGTLQAAEGGAAPLAPNAHDARTSHKHGPQHVALLQCLSDVVLQHSSPDSILSQHAAVQHNDSSSAVAEARPIHLDGFLEFGAGKGGLSVALQQIVMQRLASLAPDAEGGDTLTSTSAAAADNCSEENREESSASALAPAGSLLSSTWPFLSEVAAKPPLVVLDMDGFRRKGDARVRHSAVPLHRLRINIKDVDLTQAFLTEIRPHHAADKTPRARAGTSFGAEVVDLAEANGEQRPLQQWAVLGKHLCGACTDFALSCLTEAPTLRDDAQVCLPVCIIATCCHHRCELKHLNPPESPEAHSSQSTHSPTPLRMPSTEFTWSEAEFAALTSMSSWAVCGGFVDEERRLVGRRCKRIIDQMRVHFLRRLGYEAFQCQYTTRAVTEENVCIVAYQR